jgi:hypothetical protein
LTALEGFSNRRSGCEGGKEDFGEHFERVVWWVCFGKE